MLFSDTPISNSSSLYFVTESGLTSPSEKEDDVLMISSLNTGVVCGAVLLFV